MQLIIPQPTNISKSAASATKVDANLNKYIDLTLTALNAQNQEISTNIKVFKDCEYCITYYDADDGKYKSIQGLVIAIADTCCPFEQGHITVEYYNQPVITKSTGNCNGYKPIIPDCSCILNPNNNVAEKYDSRRPKTVTIPLCNIAKMSYAKIQPDRPPVEPPKKGYKTMIIGMTAEFIHAIVINLAFIDDQCDEAVKNIEMSVGKRYIVAYRDNRDNTTYEIDGTLTKIEEFTPCNTCTADNCANRVRTIDPDDDMEQGAGFHNSVIKVPKTDKNKFLCACKSPARDAILTFDTSLEFESNFQSINLISILDCNEVIEETPTEPDDPDTDDYPDPSDDLTVTDVVISGTEYILTLSDGSIVYVNEDKILNAPDVSE